MRLEEYVDGKLDDALAELRLKGFDLGMAVQARAPTAPAGSPAPALPATAITKYTIKAVGKDNSGDKQITVVAEGDPHREHHMDLAVFLTGWEKYQKSQARQLDADWPAGFGRTACVADVLTAKGAIAVALTHVAAAAFEAADPRDYLELVSKPVRGVAAKRAIVERTLRLVPETPTIRFYTPAEWSAARSKTPDPNAGAHYTKEVLFKTVKPGGDKGHYTANPQTANDYLVPAWLVRATTVAADANMEWGEAVWSTLAVVEWKHGGPVAPSVAPVLTAAPLASKAPLTASTPGSKASKASVAAMPAPPALNLDPNGRAVEVSVPFLYNKRTISQGAELLVYYPAVKKGEESSGARGCHEARGEVGGGHGQRTRRLPCVVGVSRFGVSRPLVCACIYVRRLFAAASRRRSRAPVSYTRRLLGKAFRVWAQLTTRREADDAVE